MTITNFFTFIGAIFCVLASLGTLFIFGWYLIEQVVRPKTRLYNEFFDFLVERAKKRDPESKNEP